MLIQHALRRDWHLEERLSPSAGYFRVVTYNVTAAGGTTRAGLNTILQAIGNEVVAGRAEPIDLITLQEVDTEGDAINEVTGLLNGLYGAGKYVNGTLPGDSTGSGTQGVVFRTDSLQLVGEAAVGTSSTTGQPRQAIRHHFQPVGYPASAAFYVYNSHYKAGPAAADQASVDSSTATGTALAATIWWSRSTDCSATPTAIVTLMLRLRGIPRRIRHQQPSVRL